jgi:hypothetical protein
MAQLGKLDSLTKVLDLHVNVLSEYDRLWVQYLKTWVSGDNEMAVEAMRGAARIAPGSKAVYNLAYSLERTNRPREELEVLESLDPDHGPMRGFWPYWSRVATALHMLGDHVRELEEIRTGRQLFPHVWELLEKETLALAALGRVDEVMELLDESLTLPPMGSWSYALVCESVALELRARSYRDAAQVVNLRAVDWLEARPSEETTQTSHRHALAGALYRAERWSEARALLEVLVEEDAIYTVFLALAVARQGDREAAARLNDALAEVDVPHRPGVQLRWQARVAAVLGDRELAVRLLREGAAAGLASDIWMYRDMDLESLRGYPPFDELMRPKG